MESIGRLQMAHGKRIFDPALCLKARRATGARPLARGNRASIAVRPELIVVGPAQASGIEADVTVAGRVKNRIFLGEHTEYLIATKGFGDVLVLSPKIVESRQGSFSSGEAVTVGWKNETALAPEAAINRAETVRIQRQCRSMAIASLLDLI